jgi:hypothetical protein
MKMILLLAIALTAQGQILLPAFSNLNVSTGGGSKTLVGSTRCNSPSTQTLSASCNYTATAGNTIIMLCGALDASVSGATISATDNKSETYTIEVKSAASSNTVSALTRFTNITSGVTSMTCTLSSGTAYVLLFISEWSGLGATQPDGTPQSTLGSSTNPVLTTGVSTSNATDLIIGGFISNSGSNSTITAGTGYTCLQCDGNGVADGAGGMEYRIVSSAGTYTVPFTYAVNASFGIVGAAYK